SEIGKSQSEQVVEETPISDNPKFGETLDKPGTNAETIIGQSSLSVAVATPDKTTPETVNESMKEKTITPDAVQDVEASTDLSNPTDAAQDVEASKDLSNP
ncbi:hypothetical protein A2U01_0071981, partial [Trifolium medium]|nr:hypothetical protein [Trifolium medium]